MVDSGFPGCMIQDGLLEKLAAVVAKDRVVWSPRLGEDGSWTAPGRREGFLCPGDDHTSPD